MAKAVIIRKAIPAIEGTPEHKVEGEPYRAAKPGFIGDPGEVQVTMTVEEAQALRVIIGHGICTAGNTTMSCCEIYTALGVIGMGRNNPFVWNVGQSSKYANGNGHGYLTDTRLPPRDQQVR